MSCCAVPCCADADAAKAQLRAQQSLLSSLLDAARQGQEAQVAQLLERGGAPDAADAEGLTALMLAAAHGRQVSSLAAAWA
jgi:ankyrin repeat protein